MINEQKRAQLQDLADQGYYLNISDYISKAFDIFQKRMGYFIGFLFIYLVITAVIGRIPYIGDAAVQLFIGPVFTVGMFIMAHKVAKDEVTGFEDFFQGTERINDLVQTALFVMGVTVVAALPFLYFAWPHGLVDWFWAFQQNPQLIFNVPEIPYWIFIFLLPLIYISVSYSWGYLFVYFYDMEPWEGLEWSRQIITRKWLSFFGFSLLVGIIGVSGALLFGIGILFTMPPAIIAQYVAFADITGLDQKVEDDISDHLIF